MLASLVAGTLAACARAPTPASARAVPDNVETLRLTGSTAAAPLLRSLNPSFQQRYPAVRLILDDPAVDGPHNASQVLAQIAEGSLPLAAIAGPPSADLWAAPIAVDALAVIVHADNPLRSLTLAQLDQVFVGRTWRWSELGVQVADGDEIAADEIVVVSREVGSGTRAAFEDQVLRARPEQEPAPVTTMAVLRLSSAEVVDYVAEHPAAIGYVALGVLDAQSGPVKAIAVENAVPGPAQVASGAYRLSLPLYLVALQEPTGAARQYVDFCLSPAGQEIIARGYVRVRE